MHVAVVGFALFGVVLGLALWWIWRQRQLAREQARINEDLAVLGGAVQAMGHDLHVLFGIVLGNLSALMEETDGDVRVALEDVRQATSSARRLVSGMQVRTSGRQLPLESAAGVMQLLVSLVRRNGVDVKLHVDGEPRSDGPQLAAFRLFQNLLSNAEHAARQVEGSTIEVAMTDDEIRVTNRVAEGARLDDSIYDEGVSGRGSRGLGLTIARAAASELGWTLRHELHGDAVTFIVAPATASRALSPADEGPARRAR